MRDGWIEIALGELTENTRPICYGVLKPGPQVDGGVPLVKITDMDRRILGPEGMQRISKELDDEFRRSRLRGGEVLLSIQGTVGRVAIAASTLKGANISRTIAVIDPDDRLLNVYLMYVLEKIATQGDFDSAGSTRESLNISTIRGMKISCPPIPEQKRIVDLISSVDTYIEALQQQLESAKRSRNAVLHELLTTGGDDWVETTIGDISTFISVRKAPNQLSSNSIYVGLEHLEPNITSINNFDSTSKVSSSLTPFDVGDVLFGRLRPYLHKVALTEVKGFCSPEILVLRANPNVLPQMLLLYCDADSTIKICVERSAGTRMPRTSTDDLASIEVKLPPMPQQEQLADLFGAFDANIARLNISLEKTQLLRSGILSDLLSGEHGIPASYDKVIGAA